MTKHDSLLLVKRFLLSLLIITCLRLGFFAYNYKYFIQADANDAIFAFFMGLRFDFMTASTLSAPFLLLSLIPYRSQFYQVLLKLVFCAPHFVAIALYLTDYEFFSFNGKLLTYDIFLMKSDIKGQFSQVVSYYWPIALAVFGLGVFLWWLYPKRDEQALFKFKLKIYPFTLTAVLIFLLVGLRGGTQLRPLSPKSAFIFKDYELGNLSLNSIFTLIHSIAHKSQVVQLDYFSTDDQALKVIKQGRNFKHQALPFNFDRPQNIVIIILESMAQEYVDQGYAPYIAKMQNQGLSFSASFANGRRSIEALPSILAGFPSLIGVPLSQSSFQSNRFWGLPRYLKDKNYSTHFFHAGAKGTMDFDTYCASLGFDAYYSKDEYPDALHFDGNWGIFDHYYLNFLSDYLGELSRPFGVGVFTLSSHQPYTMPPGHTDRYPTGVLEIHESIGYVDQALKDFFARVSKKPWYKDTLFVITADHTQKLASQAYQSLLGRFRVPIIYYHPQYDLRQFQGERIITQHADILPSVVHFLGESLEPRLYFGRSVFNGPDFGEMINYSSGNLVVYQKEGLLVYNETNPLFYSVDSEHLGLTPLSPDPALKQKLIRKARAYLQYTLNGLTRNSIYRP